MGIAYRDLDLYQGSVFKFRINVQASGVPVDLTGKTFILQVNNQSEVPAISLDASRFSSGNGYVDIEIKSEDTQDIQPFDDHTWDCFYSVSPTEKQLIGYGRARLQKKTSQWT